MTRLKSKEGLSVSSLCPGRQPDGPCHLQEGAKGTVDGGFCGEGFRKLGVKQYEVSAGAIPPGIFAPNAPSHRSKIVLWAHVVRRFSIILLHRTFVRGV